MGKSALAIVASMQIPVYPKGCNKPGCFRQPPYTRGKHTLASSARLLAFRSCVANQMTGKSGTQKSIREAFTSAAHSCK